VSFLGVGKRMNVTLESLKDTAVRPKWAHFGRRNNTAMGSAIQRIMQTPAFEEAGKQAAAEKALADAIATASSTQGKSNEQVLAKASDEKIPDGANDGSPLHPVPTEDALENVKDEQSSGKEEGTPEEAIPREMEEGQQEDKSIPAEHHPDNVMKAAPKEEGTPTQGMAEEQNSETPEHPNSQTEPELPKELNEGDKDSKTIQDSHNPEELIKASGANDGTATHPVPVEDAEDAPEASEHPEESAPKEMEEEQQDKSMKKEQQGSDHVMKSSPEAPESTSSEAIDEHENAAPRELEEGQEEGKDHKVDEVHEEALKEVEQKSGAKAAPVESTSSEATDEHDNAAPRELEEGQEESKDHKIDEVHEEALEKTGNKAGKQAAPSQPESTSAEVTEEHDNAAPRELEEGQEEGKDHKIDEVHEEALKKVEQNEGVKAAPVESTSPEATEEHDNAAPRELEEGQEEAKDHKIDDVHEEALKKTGNESNEGAKAAPVESTSSEATEEHDNAAPRELEEGQEEAKDHKIDEVHEEALKKTGNESEAKKAAPESGKPESTSSEAVDEHDNAAPRELEEGQEEGKDHKLDQVHEEALKEVEKK